MTGDMAKLPIKYLNVFQDRKGVWRYRVRFAGKSTYLEGNRTDPSVESQPARFWAAYRKIVGRPKPDRPLQAGEPGTFAALVQEYRLTPKYRKLAPRSKVEYDRYLDRMVREHGHRSVALLTAADIERLRDKLAIETPRVADWYVQLFKILLRLAVKRNYRTDNPAREIELIGTLRSYQPWTPAEIAAVWAAADEQQTLALDLLLYTGQRRGAVARMKWGDYDGTAISVEPDKGGNPVWVPCHPTLKARLDAAPRGNDMILASPGGGERTSNALGLWLSGAIRRGGMKGGVVIHGLRANAAVMLAEAGCSEKEIAAITGHKTLRMVQHYTRDADRKRLSTSAMLKVIEGGNR